VAVEAEQPGGGEGGAGAGGGGRISGDERERAATGEARPRERFGERTYSPTEAQASLNLIVEVWGEKVWGEMINAAQQPSTMRSHSVGCRIHEPNIDRFLRKLKRIG
jgi:hypothetical protein